MEILIFLVLVIGVPVITAFLSLWFGLRGCFTRQMRFGKRMRLITISLLLGFVSAYIVMNLLAFKWQFKQQAKALQDVGRQHIVAAYAYMDENNTSNLPGTWPKQNDLPEPMFTGSGESMPYIYLPVKNVDRLKHPGKVWLAHTPKPIKPSWWSALRLFDETYPVGFADGHAESLSREEFIKGLAAQPALREQLHPDSTNPLQ